MTRAKFTPLKMYNSLVVVALIRNGDKTLQFGMYEPMGAAHSSSYNIELCEKKVYRFKFQNGGHFTDFPSARLRNTTKIEEKKNTFPKAIFKVKFS